jgi:hypothetical protein
MAWENWQSSDVQRKLPCIAGSALWIALCLLCARTLNLSVPYLPLAIAGSLVFYFRRRPKLPEQISWALVSAAFGLVVQFPHDRNWINEASGVLALFGFGAFLMLGLRWLWSNAAERRRTYAVFAPAAALVFFVISAQRALSLANLLYPKTCDLYLYVFDGSLGFQPSFLAGRAMAASAIVRVAATLTYVSLPFVMALVYALRLPKDAERPSWDMIALFMLAGLGGWALYNVVPATGPGFVFKADFPWRALPYAPLHRLYLERIPVSADIPRNAIPSLHMAWVVLLYWNTKQLSRAWRIFLAVYAGLTVLSTMGTGEHYFIDLVAAVPFALFVQSVVSPFHKTALARRVVAAGSGLGLTLLWLILVRFAAKAMLVSPLFPWILVVLTGVAVWKAKSWFEAEPNAAEAQPLAMSARAGD